jgi:hypothetical protein
MLHQNSSHTKNHKTSLLLQIQNLLLQQLHQTAQPSQLHQNSSYNNTRKKHIMQPNHHAAISNDFSIKNSSCSPTAKSPPSVCSFSIKNSSCSPTAKSPPSVCSFSIKNSSCSPTAKSPPSVCSFSIKNSSCSPTCSYLPTTFSIKNSSCSPKNPEKNMQLFPPKTFLSKTAHAAQLPNSIKNSPKKIPTVGMQLFYQKQLMQPNKIPHPRYAAHAKEKKEKKSPSTSPSPHHHHHHTTHHTSPHHHHHHLLIIPPPAHTPPTKHPLTHTLHPHIPPPPSHTHAIIHPILTKPFLLYLPCC